MSGENKINGSKKPFYKKWWFAVIVLGLVFGFIFGDNEKEPKKGVTTPDVVEKDETTKAEEAAAKAEEEAKKAEEAEAKRIEEEKAEAAKEEAYASLMTTQLYDWQDQFSEFSSLTLNPQIGVESWNVKVAKVLINMTNLTEQARKLTPPKKFSGVHKLYLKAVDKYEFLPLNFPQAIDNNDSDLINKITDHLLEGNEYLDQATELIGELE